MGVSRIVVVSCALSLVAAMSVLPVEDAGSQVPSTTVIVPASGATVSGISQVLEAASSPGVTLVQYEITGGLLNDSVIATVSPTIYGWVAKWNTTTVPNGTYALQSVASLSAGGSGTSPPVSVIVNNPPPQTEIVIPASGATLDTSTGGVIDALASPGATKVSIMANVEGVTETLTTAPTLYGWIAVLPATTPCAQCRPVPVLSTLQSVASYPGGASGTSAAATITLVVYLEVVEP